LKRQLQHLEDLPKSRVVTDESRHKESTAIEGSPTNEVERLSHEIIALKASNVQKESDLRQCVQTIMELQKQGFEERTILRQEIG
jgi:hypothetical protein